MMSGKGVTGRAGRDGRLERNGAWTGLAGFMEPLARFMLWVAVAAWVLVAAAFLRRLTVRPPNVGGGA